MTRPDWELVFEARLTITAITVLPDVMRRESPVESHVLAESIEL